jgi:hypothetical protein
MGLAVAQIFLIQARDGLEWPGRPHGNSKSPSLIRVAESFRPLQVLICVESVWKQGTGLECNQRLSRKMRNTDFNALHGRGGAR